jgi:hypothetical protein
MSPEAQRILQVFRSRGLRAGGTIHPADFGEAIIWESGFVRDAPVRDALTFLFDQGYLLECGAALELTLRGEKAVYRNA